MFDLFESHNLIINDDYDKYPYKHIIIIINQDLLCQYYTLKAIIIRKLNHKLQYFD